MSDSTNTAHLERVDPASAPGALFVRIVTHAGQLLSAHPLALDSVSWQGTDDVRLVEDWLQRHPTSTIHAYVYDGDSGECVATLVRKGEMAL